MDGFNDKLKEKLDRDVSVPERLSRENITDYIEKNRNVKHVTSNNIYENHKKPVWKTIVSAAAVFAVWILFRKKHRKKKADKRGCQAQYKQPDIIGG